MQMYAIICTNLILMSFFFRSRLSIGLAFYLKRESAQYNYLSRSVLLCMCKFACPGRDLVLVVDETMVYFTGYGHTLSLHFAHCASGFKLPSACLGFPPPRVICSQRPTTYGLWNKHSKERLTCVLKVKDPYPAVTRQLTGHE